MIAAILCVIALLAVGLLLRATLHPLKVLFIPASVVAGLIGFGLIQSIGRWEPSLPASWLGSAPANTRAIAATLATWPTTLVAVVFAGLLLEGNMQLSFGQALRRGARSGICAWIIILGQIVIGLVIYMLVVRYQYADVPPTFSQLLEVSWAGGHGASGAMASIYTAQGFAPGRDIAFFLATFGLIYGVVSGLIIVNIAIRRGWISGGVSRGGLDHINGLEPSLSPTPSTFARSRSEVIDPLTLQVLIIGLAFGVGFLLRQAFVFAVVAFLGPDNPNIHGEPVEVIDDIPLFLFALVGGWLVKFALSKLGLARLIDPESIRRIVGVAMEFLIVAAISTMRIESLTGYLLPIFAMIVLAAAWSVFTLLWLSRKLLPREYWFELGLLNFGFSTANTPQGFMLLRIVDPDLKTRAAEDYAVAAPLSAPFIGGGIITFVGFPLLLTNVGPVVVTGLALALMLALYFVGRRLARSG
ncbi:MAG: hypothetical protein H7144_04020 [Burkholderiales bacterium]|nr:hypothetical protein [Phycisphaerae bacterium]